LRISGKAIYNLFDEKEEIEKIKQDSDEAETSLEKDDKIKSFLLVFCLLRAIIE